MADINLLPTDSGLDEAAVRLSNKLRQISIVEFAVLFVLAAISVGSFFLLTSRLNEAERTRDSLKTSIETLEDTETKLVLIQDRMTKARTIWGSESAMDEVTKFEEFNSELPIGVTLKKVDLFSDRTVTSLSVRDSRSLVSLVSLIRSSDEYDSVELTSIGYNPESGYEVSLSMAN